MPCVRGSAASATASPRHLGSAAVSDDMVESVRLLIVAKQREGVNPVVIESTRFWRLPESVQRMYTWIVLLPDTYRAWRDAHE